MANGRRRDVSPVRLFRGWQAGFVDGAHAPRNARSIVRNVLGESESSARAPSNASPDPPAPLFPSPPPRPPPPPSAPHLQPALLMLLPRFLLARASPLEKFGLFHSVPAFTSLSRAILATGSYKGDGGSGWGGLNSNVPWYTFNPWGFLRTLELHRQVYGCLWVHLFFKPPFDASSPPSPLETYPGVLGLVPLGSASAGWGRGCERA